MNFKLVRPGAHNVCLAGDFNEWKVGSTPLVQHQDGTWTASLPLKPGRYQYKFVVDGEWIADPAALENVHNAHGTLNSVIEVKS